MEREYFIYRITSPKGKVYIGQTINPGKRPLEYRWNVINGQVKIYRSIRKYGFENHIIEVFLERFNKEEVDKKEIELIKAYKDRKISLNITDGGYTSSHLRRRAVIKFDLKGNKLEEFISLKEAADSMNFTSDILVKALKDKLYYSKGFLWIYKDDYLKGIVPTWVAGNKGKSTLAKKLYYFDLKGNILGSFISAEEAGRSLGIKATSISQNLRGGTKRVKSFIFSYDNKVSPYKDKSFSVFTKDNEIVGTYKTINEASKSINLSKNVIWRALIGIRENKMYNFKYINK